MPHGLLLSRAALPHVWGSYRCFCLTVSSAEGKGDGNSLDSGPWRMSSRDSSDLSSEAWSPGAGQATGLWLRTCFSVSWGAAPQTRPGSVVRSSGTATLGSASSFRQVLSHLFNGMFHHILHSVLGVHSHLNDFLEFAYVIAYRITKKSCRCSKKTFPLSKLFFLTAPPPPTHTPLATA